MIKKVEYFNFLEVYLLVQLEFKLNKMEERKVIIEIDKDLIWLQLILVQNNETFNFLLIFNIILITNINFKMAQKNDELKKGIV